MTGNKCFLMTKRSVIREKTGVTDIGLKSAILVTGLTLGAGVMTVCFQVPYLAHILHSQNNLLTQK